MKKVYILYHRYEKDPVRLIDEVKILGIFSTEEKAEEAVERYKNLPGFCDFDKSRFEICAYELNRGRWSEGFVTAYTKEYND